MTLKIETASDGQTATLRLIGTLKGCRRRHGACLSRSVRVVRFLIACEAEGIELLIARPTSGSGWTGSGAREE